MCPYSLLSTSQLHGEMFKGFERVGVQWFTVAWAGGSRFSGFLGEFWTQDLGVPYMIEMGTAKQQNVVFWSASFFELPNRLKFGLLCFGGFRLRIRVWGSCVLRLQGT